MQIRVDGRNYVTDFAIIGTIDGGVEAPEPQDAEHFTEHFTAYKLTDGVLTFDEDKAAEIETEAVKDALRERRREECFPFINRGQLWYAQLTA